MPGDIGDKLKIVITGTADGELMQNILHYEVVAGYASTYAQLAEAWWLNHGDVWTDAMNGSSRINRIECYDNADPLGGYGSYTVPLVDGQGSFGGLAAGPNIAANFRVGVATRETKPGSFRFGAIGASGIAQAGYFTDAYVAILNAVGASLVTGLHFGLLDAGHAELCVYGAPHPASTRYPARLTPVYNPATSVIANRIVTTQNSRKYGHGA